MDFDENKETNKKIPRKSKKPTRFPRVASKVKTLAETEKSKGKKIALETDSDVGQIKNNTSGEKPLVIKEEPVLGNTSRSVKTLETECKSKGKSICLESDSDDWEKKKNTCGEKHESVKNFPADERVSAIILETECKSKGKSICLESESDVCWEKKKNTCGEKHESVKNLPASCGYGLANCVKVLRQMEFSEHIDKDFRQSFLSWYSLRAEPNEIMTARTFIHAFRDDLEALADQLIDAFTESISNSKKRSANGDGDGASSSGACFKKPRHN